MGSKTLRAITVTGLVVLLPTVWCQPAGAVTGSRSCTGKGTIVVHTSARQFTGARVVAKPVGPPTSRTWQRQLDTHAAGSVPPSDWTFVTPIVSGTWGASAIKKDTIFRATSACSSAAVSNLPLRKSITMAKRTCPAGQHVMINGDGADTTVISWNGGHTQSSSLDIAVHNVDTGKRSVTFARVAVRSKRPYPKGEPIIYGHRTYCSAGTTSGD